jgi:hypothetical protein
MIHFWTENQFLFLSYDVLYFSPRLISRDAMTSFKTRYPDLSTISVLFLRQVSLRSHQNYSWKSVHRVVDAHLRSFLLASPFKLIAS